MSIKFSEQTLVEKISRFIGNYFVQEQSEGHLTSNDTLYEEIYRLQQTLSQAPTRPQRRVRAHPELLEITEQQRIMDMSG